MKKPIMLAPAIALAAAPGAGWSGNGQGAAAVSLRPGLWETVDMFTTADVSGVPAGAAGAAPSVLRLRGTSTSRRAGDCPR